MKGNFGKYLYVDLSENEVKDYPIPEEWYRKYLGGRGIAARILLQELGPNTEPLSADNIMIMAGGPLQGLGIAGAARFLVMGKSPKTKTINDSFCGGSFGDILGKSGYDGIIIKGKAQAPVYLLVDNGTARILSAEDLWGLDPKQVEEKLNPLYKGCSIACIGKAGENLGMQSCIIIDRNRSAGRPAYGALMGSKNLKAIVIRGNRKKEIADAERFKKLRKEFTQRIIKTGTYNGRQKYGTPGGVEALSINGVLPTKNFTDGRYADAGKISGQALVKSKVWIGNDTCPGCPIRCKRVVEGVYNGEPFERAWGGPEYETIASFGSLLLINDLEAISLFNKKCNQYGLDTISVGVQIAYLMEATERGLLSEEDRISWGDAKAVSSLIDKIAHREGIGDWVAGGCDKISEKVGDGSFLVQCKGQEIPMHDPRGKYSLAVYYATTPRGGNHMEGTHDPTPAHPELNLPDNPAQTWENRALIVGEYLHLRSFANSAILCAFTSGLNYPESEYLFPLIRDIIEAATGQKLSVKEMLTIGERNYGLLRVFAEKAGYTREDDKLHPRFFESQTSTGFAIDEEKLNATIDEYYKLYSYDKYGPDRKKAEQLGISALL
ncbi:MAG: aldehyde ferredoxin oxidoreductase family protein [Candidatus Atribacteria bacterium]|nr:aldehyde ferredoxin oxidoreductase family protein [Candidatus Atribacteria bacterium]